MKDDIFAGLVEQLWAAVQRPSPAITKDEIHALLEAWGSRNVPADEFSAVDKFSAELIEAASKYGVSVSEITSTPERCAVRAVPFSEIWPGLAAWHRSELKSYRD